LQSDPKEFDDCAGLMILGAGTADGLGYHEKLLENLIPIKYYFGVPVTTMQAEKKLLGELTI